MAVTRPAAATGAGITAERRQAVATLIDAVRRIERSEGVTRAALEKVRALLVDLAGRKELFDEAAFPSATSARSNAVYLLSEDPDRRFALYLFSGMPGSGFPPHDHTTWACIAGMSGQEHNRIYERADDGSEPGRGTVREVRSVTLTGGMGIAFMPDDIHSVQTVGDAPTRHFHLYGMSLANIPERVAYNTVEGTYAPMGATPGIVDMRPFIAQD